MLNQNGQSTSLPATDPSGAGTDNWEVEEALDVEWAHAIAPGARIVLVEANGQSLSDLMAGVATAASQPGVSVVSMSWGFPEGQAVFASDEAAYDGVFNVPGVTFVASTGDYGAADPEYPAYSPNVVAVGGTSLTLNADGSYHSESGWGYYSDSVGALIGSGGGISLYEPEPVYQEKVQTTGGRTTPDVSLVADPATGAWIADPYNLPATNPFEVVGGTSLSAPCWAGLVALANQGRAAAREPALDSSSPTETQQALYSLPQRDYNVISSGNNGYSAGAGYNLVTGLGTPVANLLVNDLVAYHGPGTSYSGPTVGPLQNTTLTNTGAGSGGKMDVSMSSVFDSFTVTSNGAGYATDQSPSTYANSPKYKPLAPDVTTQDPNIPDPGTEAEGPHAGVPFSNRAANWRSPRVTDLQGHLLQHKPHVVHFGGHGSQAEEIILEDVKGQSRPVSPGALKRTFEVPKDNIRCVVLNACYTEAQAKGIAESIDCVVGMTRAIGDESAIAFAASFYQALGYGRSVQEAFDLGCGQIDLGGLEDEDVPKLVIATGVDAKLVYLAGNVAGPPANEPAKPEPEAVEPRPGEPTGKNETKPVEVFFSYAHEDERLRDQLEKHLSILKRQGVIAGWHDRKIGAGKEWALEINEHLESAQIILLLVSASFLASDYCHDMEMRRALERHNRGEAVIIPVLLRPVDWHGALFGKLQALPKNAKPVTTWWNRDEAFRNIAEGIRRSIEEYHLMRSGRERSREFWERKFCRADLARTGHGSNMSEEGGPEARHEFHVLSKDDFIRFYPKYDSLAEIGRGGLSQVFMADDKFLQRKVVVKLPISTSFQEKMY